MSNTPAEISSINTRPADSAAAPSGRDANGRFTKGNRGGPGNPHARRVVALKQVIFQGLTAAVTDGNGANGQREVAGPP